MRVPTLRCPPTFGPITQGHTCACVAGPRSACIILGPTTHQRSVRRCAGPSRVVCLVVGHTCGMLVPSCVMLAVRLDPTSAGFRKRDAGLTCVCIPSLPYDAPVVCDGVRHRVARRHHMQASPLRARSAGWVRGGGRCSSSTRALRNKSGAQRSAPGAALR